MKDEFVLKAGEPQSKLWVVVTGTCRRRCLAIAQNKAGWSLVNGPLRLGRDDNAPQYWAACCVPFGSGVYRRHLIFQRSTNRDCL